ncbi:thiamine pyrophosphate-dependent dehydrogenase E1 component subunit alpha [Nisaea acidiphila]|uniref:Thiamine pyrophosphate-dependent dehydrogenase E1 component subunit alpha n=1 Tax=Nisaea acidiphila TaxID=1862145 RepID=A0A9J7ASS7_9PROT|nr:thiamine pyrophosphate-dependent dehydrogenase E1 component subunit alpha [Nisaea acidiphila]UUX48413.1 thiamine pyrophosphate-dependent dehydrogenase E1 component subunit alpha [Nisaea acidiphila]
MAESTRNAAGVENDYRLRCLRQILRIRLVEETIAERYSEQEMRCPVHLSIGQEAAAVGVCDALRPDDRLFSSHRSHAHYLAKGGNLHAMMAEIYGRRDGCIGGRGGSMHLMDPDAGMMASIPIVASSIPLATGTALSDKFDGNGKVTISFIGDACLEEGVFHESANFARLRGLPVVFVCENNLYSVYTNLADRQPDRPLTDIPAAHGIESRHVDGNDLDAVRDAALWAVETARTGSPTFLLLDTYRWREHCGPNYDNHIGYRTEEEFQVWHAQDPLERYRKVLEEQGRLTAAEFATLEKDVQAEVDAAFAFATQSPLPEPSEARAHVYA